MTTISIDTQRDRAAKFAKQFETASYEMGQAQRFVTDFCEIFGIDHRRLLDFETRVKKSGGKRGRIDAFIPSLLLVEMKSAGEDLDKAYTQATEYFHGLKNEELPRSVLVSDFQNLHLYNLETHAEPVKIKLADLAQKIDHFQFLAGYERIAIENQQKINEKAAEKMADLHDEIKKTGYDGKDLENYLVRLLFCLFAEDTGLFGENGAFLNYLHNHTKIDGSDLHGALTLLFDTLNAEPKKRAKNLPEHLAKFPYINGALFQGGLSPCYFDEAIRNTLIECANLDWSDISPAIFGSLFQAVMHDEEDTGKAKTKKRREFGAHYTSEQNILKTIKPLFLDDLWEEFEKIPKTYQTKLATFHQKLAKLKFFDPACGCGNFLIIAYRELRLLELEVIKRQCGKKPTDKQIQSLILCDVDQFYGIDIDESAVQIATVALWLTDHQVNLKVLELGVYYNRIPLVKKANIINANALQLDWQSVIKPKDCSFIMGNPPFVGSRIMNETQKIDAANVIGHLNNNGLLDYVTNWHVKATAFIKNNPAISVGFVSTNSICQGEQVGTLWSYLFSQGVKIHFAHRTFKWSNEGRGVAAVHCVIIGFGLKEPSNYRIFNYEDIKGEPVEIKATQINPYLVDAPKVIITNREKQISQMPVMRFGSMPRDGGNLLLTPEEKADLIAKMRIKS
ncbi:MAG: DNA methyltransferase [Methylococcaceae bacterium]